MSQVSKQPVKVSRESLSGKWKEGTVTWSATGGTANRSGPMALVGWQDNGIARAVWLVSATDFHGAVKVVKVVKVIEVLFEWGIGRHRPNLQSSFLGAVFGAVAGFDVRMVSGLGWRNKTPPWLIKWLRQALWRLFCEHLRLLDER